MQIIKKCHVNAYKILRIASLLIIYLYCMSLNRKTYQTDKASNSSTSKRRFSVPSKLSKSVSKERRQSNSPTDKASNSSTSKRRFSAPSKLGKTMSKEQQQSSLSIPSYHSSKRSKASVIARFMKRTKHARKATALSSICSDSGLCIAFGTHSDKIKEFFHGFSEFDFVESFEQTGEDSANGFVYSVNYNHRGYTANAILKSSSYSDSDNLMYEYAVGKHINELFYYKFPIFVETYDYYYVYSSDELWQSFKSGTYTGKLNDALIPKTELDYESSCVNSQYLSILVQHIKNAPSLGMMCKSTQFFQNELINSLYQIYFTLSTIKNKFTHYDLHPGNVLVYTPRADKYIEYYFHHLSGEIITFKSKHLIKIIDYGRSFVENISTDAMQAVCAAPKCEPNCGYNYGYFMGQNLPSYLNSSKHNNSYDLKLLCFLKNSLKNDAKPAGSVKEILYEKLKTMIYPSASGGTPERTDSLYPTGILHVTDAENTLRDMIVSDEFRDMNDNYIDGLTKMGNLHIYEDGRNMKYISS